MGWVIPRPYHDILAPFSPNPETGLIVLQIELTEEELNLWLTTLISASLINDKADYVFPLWNAQPASVSPSEPISEDTYLDTWAGFDPLPVTNNQTGKQTARGLEMDTGQSISFITHEKVITIPLRGLSGNNQISVTVDGTTLPPVTVHELETVELVVDTGTKTQSAVTVEVSA